MKTTVHFLDVGQGNMVLIETASGAKFVFDCNITNENEDRVLDYISGVIGEGTSLLAFICSHRDADHIRGVKKLNARFPINKIWDSGYPGTTTNTTEYTEYMNLRRAVGHRVLERMKYFDYGRTRIRVLSAQDRRLQTNANAQGVVLKVEQRNSEKSRIEGSVMLPGDSDAETWRLAIIPDYGTEAISSDILMAAHHGSNSFFDDDGFSKKSYYIEHIEAMSPAMSIISVGPNVHGHPKDDAVKLYRKYSSGANNGDKVARTDDKKTMRLILKSGGGWQLSYNQ